MFKRRLAISRGKVRVLQGIDLFGRVIAVIGLLVAAGGLFVSYQAMLKSDSIASQSIEMAKIANEIALGTKVEAGLLEFSNFGEDEFEFDFTESSGLSEELVHVVRLENRGRRPVSGVSIELIGIEPLTYSLSDPGLSVRPLPSLKWSLDFSSAVMPSGSALVDVRKPVLLYLQSLVPQLGGNGSSYITSINFVISTRSVGDGSFMGASSDAKVNDRQLVTVRFDPEILKADESMRVLSSGDIPHRIYTP